MLFLPAGWRITLAAKERLHAERTANHRAAISAMEIHPWHKCRASNDLRAFSDRGAASFWVKQFRSDPIVMADLRSVVAAYGRVGSPLWRKSDEQILDDLSWLLSEGVLHVHRVPAPATAWHSGAASAEEMAPAASRPTPSRSSGGSPVARIVEEADTFSKPDGCCSDCGCSNRCSGGRCSILRGMCQGCCGGKESRMMMRDDLTALKRMLWPVDAIRPVRIYAILDCARHPSVYDLVARSYREKSCLFAGKLDMELERAAPFLLELQPGDSVTDEILSRGWTDAWGILVRTESSFRSLRRHLRTFLRVQAETGRFLMFRYYDPRVMTTYLPTCTPNELATIFGDDIAEIFCYAPESSTTACYSLHKEELQEKLLELQSLTRQ